MVLTQFLVANNERICDVRSPLASFSASLQYSEGTELNESCLMQQKTARA